MPILAILRAIAVLCLASPLWPQSTIVTVAGGPGDGPSALALALRSPRAVAVDSAGNIYVADTEAQRVRRITSAGAITTIAGTGAPGLSGDGGPATAAQLRDPAGLAVDSAGNLYIADSGNHRIRVVFPGGTISSVATAEPLNRPMGVAIDPAGNLLIADTENNRIRRIAGGVMTTVAGNGSAGYSGDGGAAVSAQLRQPHGVSADAAGNVYVADRWNRAIRRVAPNGVITTFASAAQLGDPYALAVDASANVYVADAINNRVLRFTPAAAVSTVAGNGNPEFSGDGGMASNAGIRSPSGVAVDLSGNVLVADFGNFRVRRFLPSGAIATVAGSGAPSFAGDGGAATAAQLFNPSGAAVDASGTLYIADSENHRIRRVTAAGTVSTYAGTGGIFHSGDGGPATAATLYRPSSLALDAAGNLYIADTFNDRVRRVSPSGVISTVAGGGAALGDGGLATNAQLLLPSAVAVDAAGNLFIADFTYRVRRVSPGGIITTVAGTGAYGSLGDGGSAVSAQLASPNGVAVDPSGNLFIADGNRIRRVAPGGLISTVGSSATLNFAAGLAADGAGGLYITDSGNHRLLQMTASGTLQTLAGTGAPNFSGEGGDPTAAALYDPRGVAVDAAGAVYLADTRNQRVRRLAVAPSTTFTTVPPGLVLTINGTSYTTPVTLTIAPGSSVTADAPLSQTSTGMRATYSAWSDGGARSHTLYISTAPATYTATYSTAFLLTRTVSPAAGGTLSAAPASGDGYYASGAVVSLTASANSGFLFTGFSGALSGAASSQNVTLSAPLSVAANFTCTYQLSTAGASVPASAGSGAINVSTGSGCAIGITSNAAWLTGVASGASVNYNFQTNPGPARSGTLIIGGQSFTVNQAPAPSFLLPTAVDTGPIAYAGNSQTLTMRFTHPAGYGYLGVLNALINTALTADRACYIAYSQPAGILFLVNDAGPDSGLSAPLVLGAPGSVSNSQCTINGPGSSVSASGNILTLTLNITFSNSFRGNKVIYLAARSISEVGSGWQTLGASLIPEAVTTYPRPNALAQPTFAAASSTLTLTYQDASNANNLQTVWALINTAVDARQACYVAYFVPANLIFLFPDNGDGGQATAAELSGNNSLENSYCRVNAQGSSAVRSGNQLTLTLNFVSKSPLAGPRGIWGAAQTLTNQVSPWKILGTWLVPP